MTMKLTKKTAAPATTTITTTTSETTATQITYNLYILERFMPAFNPRT
jgi:hypothetical protein